VVVGFVTAFLVFLVVAAVMVLAGRPGRPKRREHVSGRLVIKDEQIHALSRGDDETFLAETLVGTAKALKDLAESNEDRRGEIQTGLQWLILALVSGVIAVGVYSWAQAGDAETAEANRGTAIAPAHVGEEN
jgi:membrane protein implicated in regulation of membrane protease activity